MSGIVVGQVLWLKIRFNNFGTVAQTKHPCLVVAVEDDYIEIAHCDSLAGKEHKAAMKANFVIFCDNPVETVFDKDGFAQLDNIILLENFAALSSYRRTTDKLSTDKLINLLNAYRNYHSRYSIDENKIIFMDEAEIKSLNP